MITPQIIKKTELSDPEDIKIEGIRSNEVVCCIEPMDKGLLYIGANFSSGVVRDGKANMIKRVPMDYSIHPPKVRAMIGAVELNGLTFVFASEQPPSVYKGDVLQHTFHTEIRTYKNCFSPGT